MTCKSQEVLTQVEKEIVGVLNKAELNATDAVAVLSKLIYGITNDLKVAQQGGQPPSPEPPKGIGG